MSEAGYKFISLELLETESAHSMVQVLARPMGKDHMTDGSMSGMHVRTDHLAMQEERIRDIQPSPCLKNKLRNKHIYIDHNTKTLRLGV